jgi:uncharacterized protein YjdB
LKGKNTLTFTHPVGDTHLYQAKPVRADGTPGVAATTATWISDTPAVASVTANPEVSEDLQGTVQYLSAGTANITVASTNEAGTPYSSVFQVIVTAPPANPTVGFTFAELS